MEGSSTRRRRSAVAVALWAALTALLASGCGGGSAKSRAQTAASRAQGSITMLVAGIGTLDPARDVSPAATEVDWVVYPGLDTYRHASGQAGTTLVPAVATALPRITDSGRTYTVTVRPGLRFSDGRPVRASDVVATVERALRVPASPVRRLLVSVVRGAAAFASGRSRTLSGVTATEASGRVTIHLTRRDGAFDAILAEPALGVVPAGTPARTRADDPPAGAGPYAISDMRPGRSFELVRSSEWRPVPGIPAARLDIDVRVSPNTAADALAVLNDIADVDDAARTIPASIAREIRARAAGRFTEAQDGPVQYIFLDAHGRPFDDRLAREAVVSGLSEEALERLGEGLVKTGCDLQPAASSARAPACATGGDARDERDEIQRAAALVRRSGTKGERVTVWSPPSAPMREWMSYAARVLHEIGYATSLRVLPDTDYRSAVATVGTHASAGLARFSPQPTGAWAVGRVLGSPAVAALADENVSGIDDARGAYVFVVGEEKVPELMSVRMQEGSTVVNPIEGLDLTSLALR